MAKRHVDALYIQDGACNPSGILHSMLNACQEIRDEKEFAGTESLKTDSALRLMCHQLSFLLGGVDMYGFGDGYAKDVAACYRAAGDLLTDYLREAYKFAGGSNE